MIFSLCSDNEWLFSQEAFCIYSSCMYQPTYSEYKKTLERFIFEKCIKIYVCEVKDEKEGILMLNKRASGSEIIGIAVSEDCRNNGIGRYMIQQVMEQEQVKVLTAETDDDAVDFYRRCGFTVKTEIKEYPNGTVNRYNCVLTR